MKQKPYLFFSVLVLLTVCVLLYGLTIGPVPLSWNKIYSILISWITHPFSFISDPDSHILLSIRLPRIMLAFFVGAGLACVGSVYQGLLGNPLADPYILGSSSGAALGASCAIIMGFSHSISMPIAAFIGSVLALSFVYMLARTGKRLPLKTLLLSGVVVNAFLFALVMFALSTAGKDSGQILMWLLGTCASATPSSASITAGIMIIAVLLLAVYAWQINIISLGEEKALQLGINIEKTKTAVLILTSFMVGASVSAAGLIGFVGLIIPHINRLIIGPDQRKLLPASLLLGGIFLVLCDSLAKSIIEPRELPVGVITALCGAPFFLFLMKSMDAKHE